VAVFDETHVFALQDAALTFGPNANAGVLGTAARNVIIECLRVAGESSAQINSTLRTAADQARAMFQNLTNGPQLAQNIQAQKAIYGSSGDQVIDVFAAQTQGQTLQQVLENSVTIQAAMTTKITQLQNADTPVSNHIRTATDYAVTAIVDVGADTIATGAQQRFVDTFNAHTRRAGFIDERTSNNCYHLEITQ
jgi:hypothetical protein